MAELPSLTGKTKQIKWAEAARARFAAEMIELARLTADYLASADGHADAAKCSAAKEAHELSWIRAQTDAAW